MFILYLDTKAFEIYLFILIVCLFIVERLKIMLVPLEKEWLFLIQIGIEKQWYISSPSKKICKHVCVEIWDI